MNLRFLKQNSGISFLELIVVIAIMAILGSLGITGLVRFRQTAVLKQAAREVFSNIELARNRARNSTLSTVKTGSTVLDSKVDAYAIAFSNNDYSLYYCDRTSVVVTGVDDYICGIENENLKQAIYNDITITVDPDSSFSCQGVLFENVSGNMKLFSDVSALVSEENECTIIISFKDTNIRQAIKLDALTDGISYINL